MPQKFGVAWLALVMVFIGALPASGQSGQGIWYAGTHLGQTWAALKSDYSGRWNSGLRGQGSIFGEGLLTIATLGAGFADDAGAGSDL
ncbi:MAG: hypothetical protein JXR40_10565 [Pontiellaceae bacterium]|nr:hypothetical protein [Pontiellaceae bacterium]